MRFVVEQIAIGHWAWSLWWGDRHVADAPTTYGSESAAESAARTFQREVERAGRGVPRG